MSTPLLAIHHSDEAEKTTLGALLLDPEAIVYVAPLLKHEDFYDPVYRDIYKAIVQLYEQSVPIDFVTVNQALQHHGRLQQIGGSAFLAQLATDVPTASHVIRYAETVREKSRRRQLIRLGQQIAALGQDYDKSTEELMEAAEQGILQVSRHGMGDKPVDLIALRDERYEHYAAVHEAEDKSAHYGLTTGFRDLDELLIGLPPGDLIIVAARPSMGKTAFAQQIAQQVVENLDKTVTIFSLEMSKEQLADRTFAGALGVSTHMLRKGLLPEADFQRMGKVFDGIKGERLFIDDDADRTLVNLRSKARRQQMEHGLDLLIVDYLQLIEVTGPTVKENRVQQISQVSRQLKQLARELHIPVIAVSQLSRNVENRPDKRPQLSDLRESGSIEQDADTVLMLYREDYYDEDTDRTGMTDVYVRKHRQGPTGRFELLFNRERMAFSNVAQR